MFVSIDQSTNKYPSVVIGKNTCFIYKSDPVTLDVMDAGKSVLKFGMNAITGFHDLNPVIHYDDHTHVVFFSKVIYVDQELDPNPADPLDLDSKFTSAVNMLRLFIVDKFHMINEIVE